MTQRFFRYAWLVLLAACAGGPICDFPKMLSADGERCLDADGADNDHGDGDGDGDVGGDGDFGDDDADRGDGDGSEGGLDAGTGSEHQSGTDGGMDGGADGGTDAAVDADAGDASLTQGHLDPDAGAGDAGDAFDASVL